MNPYALFVGSVVTGLTLALAWDAFTRWLARRDADLSHLISDALDERPASEQHAGLYDHPPIFAEVEADLGPIFAAGVERQVQRLHDELEDDGGIWAWLDGGGAR